MRVARLVLYEMGPTGPGAGATSTSSSKPTGAGSSAPGQLAASATNTKTNRVCKMILQPGGPTSQLVTGPIANHEEGHTRGPLRRPRFSPGSGTIPSPNPPPRPSLHPNHLEDAPHSPPPRECGGSYEGAAKPFHRRHSLQLPIPITDRRPRTLRDLSVSATPNANQMQHPCGPDGDERTPGRVRGWPVVVAANSRDRTSDAPTALASGCRGRRRGA